MRGAKQILGATLAAVAVSVLANCANDRGPYPNLPPIGLRAEFTSRNLCGLGLSPEILLGNAPQNAATLRGPRWQADLPATGASIPEAALEGFDLPCPGEKQLLTYRLEIMALAANGQPLGYGWAFVTRRSPSRSSLSSAARRAASLSRR
jgi:hypothetical protein